MFALNCKGKLLVAGNPLVMGIINSTPDSFYAGSRHEGTDAVLRQVEQMIKDGADIIDIGGQSTRPGSEPLSAGEELKRVIGAIEAVHTNFPEAFISIDTYYASVATEAVATGASIVNDISGGTLDENMITAVASLNVPYVLMHIQGRPQTMQHSPHYENVTREVLDYFIVKINECRAAGIKDIIIDPGFGFGKSIAHNFELLNHLSAFSMLECPLLIGISRKSTVYKTLGIPAGEALNGTTVLHTIALLKGATILRVHDVKEAKEAIRLVAAYKEFDSPK